METDDSNNPGTADELLKRALIEDGASFEGYQQALDQLDKLGIFAVQI
jgi:hypothetical protein